MIILGVHSGHNSSACLMIDGEIVGAVQEERFSKIKNQVAIPVQSIRHLIRTHLDGDSARVDQVVLPTRDVDPIGLAISRYSDYSVHDHLRENKEYWYGVFYEDKPNDGQYWKNMYQRGELLNTTSNLDTSYMNSALNINEMTRLVSDELRPRVIQETLGRDIECQIMDHHSCHGYYAFYGADIPREKWDETLVLSADSWGDGCNHGVWTVDAAGSLVSVGGGGDHGVARIYRFTTQILGMKPNEHEYKIMGLSGYSKPGKYIDAVKDIFFEALDFVAGKFVCKKPLREGYFDLRDRLEGHRFDNVSAALQEWSTDVTAKWIRHWLKTTRTRGLCFSGGLSMNIKSNGDFLDRIPELEWLSVPASGGDETTPLGACYMMHQQQSGQIKPMDQACLGHVIGHMEEEDDWKAGITNAGANHDDYTLLDNIPAAKLARLLAADVILARCTGPMEFGARALGNRSIIANPSNPANLKSINDAIKNRDFWMPFTPSIREERAGDYLLNPKQVFSPYMTIGFQSNALAKDHLPAALHPGDFSARPQFVRKETHEAYWTLIHEFEKLTGIGALLNTSLNLHGDPMNASIADAARTLAKSALSCLVLPDDQLLVKNDELKNLQAIMHP